MKIFCRIWVAYEIFLMSDFFHRCVVTRIMEEQLTLLSCVRGYHLYQDVWDGAIGEILTCERKPSNSRDRYAVVVKKEGSIVGQLPKNVKRVCSLFLQRGSGSPFLR